MIAICSRCGRKGDAETQYRSGWTAVTNDDNELIRWESRKGAWFCIAESVCEKRRKLNEAQARKDERRAGWAT